MKKILLLSTVLFSFTAAFAAAPKGWTTDYEAALKRAKAEKKYVYVLFTGSDWCGWCKKLRSDVLEKNGFQKLMKKKIIAVYCDFPQRDPLPAEQIKKQLKWHKELQASGGVPSAVIVNSEGKVVGDIGGYMPEKEYLKKLERMIK